MISSNKTQNLVWGIVDTSIKSYGECEICKHIEGETHKFHNFTHQNQKYMEKLALKLSIASNLSNIHADM